MKVKNYTMDNINNKEVVGYLNKLLDGNNRFINEKSIHPNTNNNTIRSLINGQKPFATVITCSDSRVPPELIFDVGIGDIFVIRTAGHVLTDAGLASLEYAIEHLHTKLIIVLGHTHCGAVKSAVKSYDSTSVADSHLNKLIETIKPSVEIARCSCHTEEDVINLSIDYNIYNTINSIKTLNNNIQKLITNNEVVLIPAKYDIETGKVELLKY